MFVENFYIYRRTSRAVLKSTVMGSGTPEVPQVAEIERHLNRGNQHYSARRYVQALDEYKICAALVYALLEVDFDPLTTLGDDVVPPVTKAVIDKLVAFSQSVGNITAARAAAPTIGTTRVALPMPTAEYYEDRVDIKDPGELGLDVGFAYEPGYFQLNLAHHYLFTTQLCLGDTYLRLGRFQQALDSYVRARDYPYLNVQIEAPVVWIKLAECLLAWGRSLYFAEDAAGARQRCAQIVIVAADGTLSIPTAASSPLYGPTPFTAIATSVAAYVAAIDSPTPPALNPLIAAALHQARVYQDMIRAGLNALGLPDDMIPIFRFRYLESVARYFANQAMKAERDYINFAANAERETAGLMQLQQSVDLAQAGVELERRRVAEADTEARVAQLSAALAAQREANAVARRDEYSTVSADQVALDTASAHASGGFTETEGGYQVHLATSGETVNLGDQDYIILRNAAWRRGMILRQFELDEMQRTISEYHTQTSISQAVVAQAEARRQIAAQNQRIAELRLSQAQDNLAYARDKTFNTELWNNLADHMRAIAAVYLQRAVEIAFMMQQAYNFEMDEDLRVIRMSYSTGEALADLLGGDTLLRDIDYFTYHHLTQARRKEIPLKLILSLAERDPFSIYQFRRTGTANFETRLSDFDRMYPGGFLCRIKTVEVAFEGVVGVDGIRGSLKNAGTSTFRTADNGQKIRLQPSETMFLSSYSPQRDALVLRPSDELLGVFEATGVATAWTLSLPPDANDIDFQAISDVKLVLHLTCYHDPQLEAAVRASLPTTGAWSRGFSLRNNFPDALFLLLESGTTDFTIEIGDFPYTQVDFRVTRVGLYVITDPGTSAAGVTIKLQADASGHEAIAVTGADGTVSAGPLDVFRDDLPIGRWTLSLDPASNPGLFRDVDGLSRIKGLRDLVVMLDYSYRARGTT